VNRALLAALALIVLLAAGACGRYGPPVRPLPGADRAVDPAAPTAEAPDADDDSLEGPVNPGDIETFEDEP
jgi:predicted small lipoprotein YifL